MVGFALLYLYRLLAKMVVVILFLVVRLLMKKMHLRC